jgi:hypothetical protein
MVLMVYSGARGTLIYEKNLKSKFSCQTPFKAVYQAYAHHTHSQGLWMLLQIKRQ